MYQATLLGSALDCVRSGCHWIVRAVDVIGLCAQWMSLDCVRSGRHSSVCF